MQFTQESMSIRFRCIVQGYLARAIMKNKEFAQAIEYNIYYVLRIEEDASKIIIIAFATLINFVNYWYYMMDFLSQEFV